MFEVDGEIMFIDHFSLGVSDLAQSSRFYDAVLATIGARRLFERPDFVCYGTSYDGFFVLNRPDDGTRAVMPNNGFHVCFSASDKAAVLRFHTVALAEGGRDNGAPGYRAQYAPDYYGAFVIDPDGHHLGVVCRTERTTL